MDAQAVFNLVSVLEHEAAKSHRPESSVLFRRGEKALGIFLVLSGKVKLDLGVDNGHGHCYGYGALLGLPETLTGRDYNMSATVTEDAEIGFIPSTDLRSLLYKSPILCRQMLALLNQRKDKPEKDTDLQNDELSQFARNENHLQQ